MAPAELAIALMLASRRNIAFEAERMRRGDWPCTLSHRLRGSTLGIFGLGAIGSLVAQAGRGLGMNVLAFGQEGSRVRAAAAGYDVAASKAELFAEQQEVVYLEISRRRLALLGINEEEIYRRLQAKNVAADGGRVRVSDQYIAIDPTGAFRSAEGMLELAIG